MSEKIVMRTGEATVFASPGQYTDAMPEIVIGRMDGPVGAAFANLMGQTAGHTSMFAVRDCNQMAKPATMMVPKVTIKNSATVNLLGGGVTKAVAANREWVKTSDAQAYEQLTKAGIKITQLTPDNRKTFQDRSRESWGAILSPQEVKLFVDAAAKAR